MYVCHQDDLKLLLFSTVVDTHVYRNDIHKWNIISSFQYIGEHKSVELMCETFTLHESVKKAVIK